MKTKRKTRKRNLKPVTEARILQLSNDISEDITSGSLREWKAVALYFRREHDRVWNELGTVRCSIAATVGGRDIYSLGMKELTTWLNRQTPESTA